MLALRVEHDLFLPWTFDREQTRHFLAGIQNHAVVDMITQLLGRTQLHRFVLHPNICHLLSTTCLLCGGTFHPAVLSEHIKAMHCSSCLWIPAVLPQLLQAFLKTVTCDFQCKSCELVFNLPITEAQTPEQQTKRDHLVQIHAQHHCPVVYQTGLLLTHGLPSSDRRSADGRCGNPGGLQGDGTLLLNDKFVRDPGTEKEPKKHKRKPCPGEHSTGSGGDQIGETHGQHDSEIGCGTSTDEKTTPSSSFCKQEEPALLPQLLLRAKAWHAQMKQRVQQPGDQPPYVPLRTVLFQDMATLLEDRVQKLSKANSQDPFG